ncbi:hypothetical protein [Synechococcus sp. MIT S9504]|uniref:hypothetical protein n=1 Tax=Synechococcus sp. MIT S9504 TaxID=1801628 RepID=UPI0007BBD08A|nr:hypothetical protein [Synechococcus sp. MIT S9504]KZR84132.1 hypothetical protein MITS9504_03109 [Synechococcus sp. MIT S9504]
MLVGYEGNDVAVREYLARNGNKVEVPDDVVKQQRGGAFIEKKVRSQIAKEQADAEREAADQEVLSARIATVEAAEAPEPVEEQTALVTPDQAAMLANAALHDAGAIASHSVRSEEAQLQLEQATARLKQESEATLTSLQKHKAVLLEEVKAATERANQATAELEAYKESTRDELWSEIAKDEYKGAKGDKGDQGLRGSGFAYCDSDPTRTDPKSGARKWFGFDEYAPGDNLVRGVEGGLEFWLTPDAQSFQRVDFRTNKQDLVSKHLNIQDASTKVNAPVTNTTIKSGGGGSTPLANQLVSGVAGGAAQRIGDGAAYGAELERTGQYARACEVILRVSALDGPQAGRSDYVRYDLLVENNTAASETVSAMLGRLNLGISLRLPPAGSGTVPAWAPNGAATSATHTPVIEMQVDSNASGVTQLAVEGSINWVLPTDGGKPLKATW